MKKILLVKITSMGDLIQMLPALTDAQEAIPGIQFDWLCEDSFQDIPALHPSIRKIIALPYRRWKKNIREAIRSGEIKQFLKSLRAEKYDMIIDAQSNIKSALFALLAKGPHLGLDRTSVREFGAHFFYRKTISIDRNQNHTLRMRELLAKFLNYPLPPSPYNYGIPSSYLEKVDIPLPSRFIFLTVIASMQYKLWPEENWEKIIRFLLQQGFDIVMPWWSQAEKERVTRLQNNHPKVHLLPPLNLKQKAYVLSQAKGAVSLDTGLAHMAVALNIPNICLYGPNDARFCGTMGANQQHLTATSPDCVPCNKSRCRFIEEQSHTYAPCMVNIQAEAVEKALNKMLAQITVTI